jgi:hypothetical protein
MRVMDSIPNCKLQICITKIKGITINLTKQKKSITNEDIANIIMPYHVILEFTKQSEDIALPLPLSFEIKIYEKMNISIFIYSLCWFKR